MQHAPIAFRKEKRTIKRPLGSSDAITKLHLVGHGSKIEFGTSSNGCQIAFLHGNLDDEIYMNKLEGLWVARRKVGVQDYQIIVYVKTIPKTMVQTI